MRKGELILHSTHRRIAEEVILRLNAPSSRYEMSRLMEGVIAPDVDKVPRHHYDNSHLTNRELQEARSAFLRDDLPNAYYHLGEPSIIFKIHMWHVHHFFLMEEV